MDERPSVPDRGRLPGPAERDGAAPDWRALVHRICYQSDTHVVTACGVAFPLTRDEVRAADWLTIWRGSQTCPDCPNELEAIPDAARMLLNPKKVVTGYNGPMIDLHEFGRRLTDRLVTIAAENRGESRIESVRRYHTDATFHAMVDTIVLTACAVVQDMEQMPVDERMNALTGIFHTEADGLLS